MRYQSRSEHDVELVIQAPDASTEVFVIDSGFRRIASGLGSLRVPVKPGLYKVRFRSGSAMSDQLVEVPPDAPEIVVQPPAVEFRSAAPIDRTETMWEHHRAPAAAASRRVHLQAGSGSEIFLCVRDRARSGPSEPWRGVSLCDAEGTHVADLTGGELDRRHRIGAINVAVDPGAYRLRVETRPLGTYELFVVACPGWQTQVFTMAADFSVRESTVRRPELRSATVLMARSGAGFDPSDPKVRLTELARQGLEQGRLVIARGELEECLDTGPTCPMLGLLALHLLLRHGERDPWLGRLAAALEQAIGPHPDLAAARLHPALGDLPSGAVFDIPPTLAASWRIVIQASQARSTLVPAGSLTQRLTPELLPAGAWMLHRIMGGKKAAAEPAKEGRLDDLIARLARVKDAVEVAEIGERVREDRSRFSPLEQRVFAATRRAVAPTPDEGQPPEELPAAEVAKLSRQMMRVLDAPPAAVRLSVGSLLEKLDDLLEPQAEARGSGKGPTGRA